MSMKKARNELANLGKLERLLTPFNDTNTKFSESKTSKVGDRASHKNKTLRMSTNIASSSNSSNSDNDSNNSDDRDSSEVRAHQEKKK